MFFFFIRTIHAYLFHRYTWLTLLCTYLILFWYSNDLWCCLRCCRCGGGQALVGASGGRTPYSRLGLPGCAVPCLRISRHLMFYGSAAMRQPAESPKRGSLAGQKVFKWGLATCPCQLYCCGIFVLGEAKVGHLYRYSTYIIRLSYTHT